MQPQWKVIQKAGHRTRKITSSEHFNKMGCDKSEKVCKYNNTGLVSLESNVEHFMQIYVWPKALHAEHMQVKASKSM